MKLRCCTLAALAALVTSSVPANLIRERCSWSGSAAHPAFHDVIMSPLVVDLDGDGVPEIIFAANDPVHGSSLLEIISGSDCTTIAEIGSPGCVQCFGDATCRDLDVHRNGAVLRPEGLAAGDLDGDGRLEIVGVVAGDLDGPRRLMAFNSDGSFRWCSDASPGFSGLGLSPLVSVAPSLADLDGDGIPEIVVGTAVFSSNGQYLGSSPDSILWPYPSVPADVDRDGRLEIAAGPALLRADGTTIWDRRVSGVSLGDAGSVPVDLDGDGMPEIVLVQDQPNVLMVLDGRTGSLRALASMPGDPASCWSEPGLPAVGDVDGNGRPDIVVSSGTSACLFEWDSGPPEGLIRRWCAPVRDCSGGWPSPILVDLNGDGRDEIALRDEHALRILGGDGTLLQSVPNSAATNMETVVAADVNGDCTGALLVPADDIEGGANHGLRIFEGDDAPLPPFRPVWNERQYHVTNVTDVGSIPRTEAPTTSFHAQVDAVQPPADIHASTLKLWPPNHRMVRVAFADSSGRPVQVTRVMQDEPVDGRGDGHFAPDAILDGDGVYLRAERSGGGDGRAYHVDLAVGRGACTVLASITICVPHDQRRLRRNGDCGDQGALYDSTASGRP